MLRLLENLDVLLIFMVVMGRQGTASASDSIFNIDKIFKIVQTFQAI